MKSKMLCIICLFNLFFSFHLMALMAQVSEEIEKESKKEKVEEEKKVEEDRFKVTKEDLEFFEKEERYFLGIGRLVITYKNMIQYDTNVYGVSGYLENKDNRKKKDIKDINMVFFMLSRPVDVKMGRVNLTGGYIYYHTIYKEDIDYNLLDHIIFISSSLKKGDITYRLWLDSSFIRLGQKRYMSQRTFKPNIIWRQAENLSAKIGWRLRFKDYVYASENDAYNNQLKYLEYISLGEKGKWGTLCIGGAFEHEETVKRSNRYNSWIWEVDYIHKDIYSWKIKCKATCEFRNFSAPSIISDKIRRDMRTNIKIKADKKLSKELTLNLEYKRTIWDSNIGIYKRHRNIYGIGITYKF